MRLSVSTRSSVQDIPFSANLITGAFYPVGTGGRKGG
jgi:hypothetical protein